MIKIAICDDDLNILSLIETKLYEIANRYGMDIDVSCFEQGTGLLKEITKQQKYDLIFLDIKMEDTDGISVAEEIRKKDENVIFIFVSAYERYMMELFQLDVFAFIKKPIQPENLEKTFLKAQQKIANKHAYFLFQYKKEEFKVLCNDILYFESSGRKIKIFLINGDVPCFNGKLNEVEDSLKGGKIPFLRVHQSYLVNYYWIRSRTKKDVSISNGKRLPISEDRQKSFTNEYVALIGGEISV